MTMIDPQTVGLPSIVYAKDHPKYLPLPCYKEADGTITIMWKLTLKERLKLLFKGILYHQVLTFNNPLQPIKLSVDSPIEGL